MIDSRVPQHNPNLIWQTVDSELVIVSPAQGKVRALNELGANVWQLIDRELTVDQICSHLCQVYATVPRQTIEKDLQAFITDLDQRELIIWQKDQRVN